MPIAKDMNLKKGDVVSVRATVTSDVRPGAVFVHLEFNDGHDGGFDPDILELELVQPKFAIGEWVMSEDGLAVVKGISGEEAWVDTGSGGWIAKLKDLKRDPPPAPPSADDVLAGVAVALNADPNVHAGFCDGITNGPSFARGGL